MKSKLNKTVEEEILKLLRRDRDKACVEFIYDKKTWLNILNQPKEERAREGVVIDQYALTTSENYVFRDLFKCELDLSLPLPFSPPPSICWFVIWGRTYTFVTCISLMLPF